MASPVYNDPVTWSFLFLASLLLGLVMAATSGLLRRITGHRLFHQITVPDQEHRSVLISVIARRCSLPLAAFGTAGLLLWRAEPPARLTTATVVALAAGAIAVLVMRRHRERPLASRAVVIRAIPANGFGQVGIAQGRRTLVLAARSEDGHPIPVGCAIEMVDCESSVLTVRPAGSSRSA